jgi:hypothetical protein
VTGIHPLAAGNGKPPGTTSWNRSITEAGTTMESYYGRPVIKEPVWQPEIPFYFFTGGLGGASAVLSLAAEIAGNGRLAKLQAEGWNGAELYGRDPDDGVGGFGAFFLLLDEPEVYGLPPDPVVPTKHLPELWASTALAATAMFVGVALAFVGGRR